MNDDLFRTKVNIPRSEFDFGYQKNAVMMGSCFVENIGAQLKSYKYQVDVNPFGVIYNPVSVCSSLRLLMEEKEFLEDDLNFHNDLWFSFYHHSKFSNSDLSLCLSDINDSIKKSSQELKEADFLFITFGTAWVYELLSSGKIVSNCHKLPAKDFNRYRLDVDEIVSIYKDLLVELLVFNPKIKVVFTVSPIRHWKDGANGNQLSKATLLLAVEQLSELFDQVSYFPSYEIVMDELRDYRFYTDDMLHISNSAIKYIWQRFLETYLSEESKQIQKQVEKFILAANHRPFNVTSESHQTFIKSSLAKLHGFLRVNPTINMDEVIGNLERNLL
ncbi:GSCFA domain protein [Ancylomarina euxinus]|uniref:GSCFA domain protein n=1 Tax=Ancylomarina euxinus TaxID=2283627 RepID=A0A425XZ64_9BACT|nr:GSCFA domain-containing protein [Ancylomarina euxinus]MCZ4695616.1 GSCFA domain-containing protein [Ancylomarina euxinus]MUP16080.1 GSCFA domain protein [Ancylomarina euxinus]RRG20323.1 GSCFA domain protein [Ancylomarina euxinus]